MDVLFTFAAVGFVLFVHLIYNDTLYASLLMSLAFLTIYDGYTIILAMELEAIKMLIYSKTTYFCKSLGIASSNPFVCSHFRENKRL